MTDLYANHGDTDTSPSRAPYAVTPSETVEAPVTPKSIYVGTGGDLTVRGLRAEADVTYRNLLDAPTSWSACRMSARPARSPPT